MTAKLRCPKCGGDVRKGGTANWGGSKRGQQRFKCKKASCDWHGTQPVGLEDHNAGIDEHLVAKLHTKVKRDARRVRRFVVTAAQNATPIHKAFFDALTAYCRFNSAQLLVIPYRYKNPCLAPETRALTADLRWVPVGQLSVGDTLVGFDENSTGRGKGRLYKTTTVTCAGRAMMPAYRVDLDDGTSIVASEDHPWLVDESGKYRWRKTKDLIHSKGGARIVRVFDTWEKQTSRESGYIAAALDGEGSLIQQPDGRGGWQLHLTYTQKTNAMSVEVERCMTLFGVRFNRSATKNGVSTWHVQGGRPEIARVLGQHRPVRLLEKFCPDRWGRLHSIKLHGVVACERIGPHEVVTLSTTSGTLIAEGLATHNTSMWTEEAKTDDWWAPELVPYLYNVRHELNKNLIVLADIKTQPTARRPLEGFETIAGDRSAIIGHPKLELTTVAAPHQKLPKILTTTGACTEKNYIPSKAGKQGEFHHTFGACVVEIEGDLFYMRQINALNDGSFMDLEWEYRGSTRKRIERAAALVMGDSHVEFIDPLVVKATFDRGGIIDRLRPEYVVWHDAHDFYSCNHHDRDKVFVTYAKHQAGKRNVERGLRETFAFIDDHTAPDTTNVFVPSNHPNDHLERWVNETDPRKDPENCVFWARTFEAMCLGSKMTESGAKTIDPFYYWAERMLKKVKQAKFIAYDESFLVHGVELGFHGHLGPNGARGTRRAYGKIGVKTIIGHAHSPGILDGVYQTGTSSRLRLAYNHGPSSWLQTHALLYANGKRTLVNIVEGKYRA